LQDSQIASFDGLPQIMQVFFFPDFVFSFSGIELISFFFLDVFLAGTSEGFSRAPEAVQTPPVVFPDQPAPAAP
jgi:hypothetical protein